MDADEGEVEFGEIGGEGCGCMIADDDDYDDRGL